MEGVELPPQPRVTGRETSSPITIPYSLSCDHADVGDRRDRDGGPVIFYNDNGITTYLGWEQLHRMRDAARQPGGV